MFAERLLLLRKETKETQRQLADFLHVTQSAINKWEGDKNEPDIRFLNAIADHYNVSVDYLTGRTQIRQGNIPEKLRHPITEEDIKKYEDFVRNAANAYFWNDKIAEEDKLNLIHLMTDDFWDSLMKLKDKRQ